jgi:hypothetical protein
MRPIGDLMVEMGFNKDAPMETQKAFIRHLIRAANVTPPPAPALPQKEVQLSFDPEILGIKKATS